VLSVCDVQGMPRGSWMTMSSMAGNYMSATRRSMRHSRTHVPS